MITATIVGLVCFAAGAVVGTRWFVRSARARRILGLTDRAVSDIAAAIRAKTG
jgi:hypothetical protein